eukprot:s27_g32.t1
MAETLRLDGSKSVRCVTTWRSQSALPGLNCELQTPDLPTAGPQQRVPDLSSQRQWALPDLNHKRRI